MPTDTLTTEDAVRLAGIIFGLAAEVRRLDGEFDDNFLLLVAGQPHSVLKVSRPEEQRAFLDLQAKVLGRLGRTPDTAAFQFPQLLPTRNATTLATVPDGCPGAGRFIRLLSYIPGCRHLAEVVPCPPPLLTSLGTLLATVDRALRGLDDPAAHRTRNGSGDDRFRWALADSLWVRDALTHVKDPRRRALAGCVLDRVEREGLPLLPALRHSVIHGDASEYNVLVRDDRAVALIDLGDLHWGPTVGELAVGSVYAMFGVGDPLGAGAYLVAGYNEVIPLTQPERLALFPFILARLAVSVVNAALRNSAEPDNAYFTVSSAPGWAILEQLAEVPSRVAEAMLFSRVDDRRPLPSVDTLRVTRQRALGPSLSLSYRTPLHIVRGWKQYLYDVDGLEYLDAYNNVAHVGHCHPHVVDAIARQAALLNTNTRYLHHLIGEYAERLTALVPAPLGVCYFVNSGSEANELALRLARAHTRQRDMIVSTGAYHGNTQKLIDVSPYKYAGAGGEGREPWVHEVPLPDVYRGPYKASDPEAGAKYAQHVGQVVDEIQAAGRGVCAFLFESLPSVGGQIIPPPGYLAAAYAAVRAAGGLCIADEVQVGFGRVGTHFWGFELQGVVPDIVVCGKPIGNGHPLGAVITTPGIAASFANGMEYFNTFGGNPVSMAAGLAVLKVLAEEGLQAHALEVGNQLLWSLRPFTERHRLVGDVRGAGLFVGVELVRDRTTLEPADTEAAQVVNALRDRRILAGTDGPFHNVIKIRPPMPFDMVNADRLVSALDGVLLEGAESITGSRH
jgi:4-aminobutyrate aminotransferase-like enzyme/Ser/Thr protein kinase RdoA (MazF antagonist)